MSLSSKAIVFSVKKGNHDEKMRASARQRGGHAKVTL